MELAERVRKQVDKNGNCVTCGCAAATPWRRHNADGEVIMGCIDVAHVGVCTDEWMLRDEVQVWIADLVLQAEAWAQEEETR